MDRLVMRWLIIAGAALLGLLAAPPSDHAQMLQAIVGNGQHGTNGGGGGSSVLYTDASNTLLYTDASGTLLYTNGL